MRNVVIATGATREALGALRHYDPTLDRGEYAAALIALCYVKRAAVAKGTAPFDLLSGWFADFSREVAGGRFADFIADATRKYDTDARKRECLATVYGILPNDPARLDEIILSDEVDWPLSSRDSGLFATPRDLCDLAVEVLGIEEGDTVADFGAGIGTFLTAAAGKAECKYLYGCEANKRSASILGIKMEVLGCAAGVDCTDMFLVDGTFDRCFSNYPFGAKSRTLIYDLPAFLGQPALKGAPCPSSGDWLYNMLLVSKLADGGRAAAIMSMGAACNGADEAIREHFVSNGWIEAVISLPEGVFAPYTNIPTVMVVLSRDNEAVRFVDAASFFKKGRRDTTLDAAGISQIVSLLGDDCKGISCARTYGELADEGFALSPDRYLSEKLVVENGVPVSELSEKITRGSACKRDQLEELHSSTPTANRYLMLQNIVDGEVEADLPYLTEVDASQEKYCVEDGDILLSKMGPKFKVAVAEVPDGERVLATGNLYIIRVDRQRVNPIYMKLCLESEQGAEQLRRVCVGTTVPNIPAKGLDDVLIPLIPLPEQEKIAGEYLALKAEVDAHKHAIRDTRQKMAELLS